MIRFRGGTTYPTLRSLLKQLRSVRGCTTRSSSGRVGMARKTAMRLERPCRPRSPPPAIPIAGNRLQLRLLISTGWHACVLHERPGARGLALQIHNHDDLESHCVSVWIEPPWLTFYTGERFANMVAKSTGTVPPRSLRSSYLTASCALVFFPQSLRAAPKAWSGWFRDNSSEIAAPSALLL